MLPRVSFFSPHTDRADRRALLLLAALAFGYRLLFLLAVPRVLDNADAVHYAEAARLFASGGWLEHNPKIPALYPLLGAFASLVTGDAECGGRVVSLIASSLTVIPVYLIARAMFDARISFWAGLSVALWPWLADYACAVSTESLAVLLWLSAVALLMERASLPRLAAAGTLLGALYLTRAEGVVILLAALPVVALMGGSARERLRHLATYAAGALPWIVAGVWTTRVWTGRATAAYRAEFIVEEFDLLRFAHTAAQTITDVAPVMLGPLLLVFLGAFVVSAVERGMPRGAWVPLWFAAVQWGASWFVLSPAPRYLMAPLIVLALFAAAGMLRLSRTFDGRAFGFILRQIPQVLLVLWFLFGAVVTLGSEHAERRPRQPREYKDAGLWMREHLEPGLVFTRKPQVAYYAGMPSTGPLDSDSQEEALARAAAAGAAYLVVDERYVPAGLRPLLEMDAAPDGWRMVYESALYPEARVKVFARGGA
jgi:4-amino-4-deoxy-L-arabinose transferase-like glycosyltransferase